MTRGQFRARTFRRVKVKTPGGQTVMHHVLRKPAKSRCANCDKVLAGTPQVRPAQLRRLTKTEKRPSRPYGGVLCSACAREQIKIKARKA